LGVTLFFLKGLREEFDRTLAENYERGVRHIEVAPSGGLGMRKPEKTPQNPNRDFAHEMPVEAWSPDGTLLYRSPAWESTRLSPVPPVKAESGDPITTVRASDGQSFRIMSGHSTLEGRDLWVRVGMNEERVWKEIRELLTIFIFILPVALLLSGGAGYWMASQALRPVQIMSKRAQVISAESLHDRLPIENPEDELGSLAKVFNGLLERLQGSFEELKRFTSDASHELRTPLQALRSIGEVALQSEQRPEYYREVISSMLEETDRMAKLTQSLLTLSRADSGHVKLNYASVKLEKLVEEAMDLLEILAEEKTQKLVLNVQDKMEISADPVFLRQAVINLVDNAIKYSPSDTEIVTRLYSDTSKQVVIEVRDKGPGIAPEYQERVFDRFYRIDKSRSRDLGGAGLGLAITKWAIEAHGGKIELESTLGLGSTFRIFLPLALS